VKGLLAMTNQQKSVSGGRLLAAVLVALAAAVAATFGIHQFIRTSSDSCAAAIGAVATVVLVAVTAWYTYLTFKLLVARRSSARTAARETATRDLILYLTSGFRTVFDVEEFPGLRPAYDPRQRSHCPCRSPNPR
jgi:hypothetical protein